MQWQANTDELRKSFISHFKETVTKHIIQISLPENHKVVTTKMQLFRRVHFVITFLISFYKQVHVLCQLEQNNCKTT